MIVRAGTGWQYVMTDLSLILFMICASALSEAPPEPPQAAVKVALPALGEPVALWRQGPDTPPLKDWLAATPDPRLRLTIMASPAEAGAALSLAATSGRPARVLLEPDTNGVIAALTYDQPTPLARGLQSGPAKENSR